MRIPDWLFRRLARLVDTERRRRRSAVELVAAQQDAALRAWADKARAAHRAGNCIPGCPYDPTPSTCRACPPGCRECSRDIDCECYTHDDPGPDTDQTDDDELVAKE